MKLSDAIREGCENSGQSFGRLWRDDEGNYKTCVLGAIMDAHGVGSKNFTGLRVIRTSFPVLMLSVRECPVGCSLSYMNVNTYNIKAMIDPSDFRLRDVMVHLNNHHKWSREKIAGWIDEFAFEKSEQKSQPQKSELTTIQ